MLTFLMILIAILWAAATAWLVREIRKAHNTHADALEMMRTEIRSDMARMNAKINQWALKAK